MNILGRSEETRRQENLPHRRHRECRGNPREHRQGLLVANLRPVGRVNRTHDTELRGKQATRRCSANRPVNLEEAHAQVVNRSHVARPSENLTHAQPSTPRTLEGILKATEHAPGLPVASQSLGLEKLSESLAGIRGGLILDTAVHAVQHLASHLVVAATELLEAENARGLEPLELHVIAVRGLATPYVHIQGHPQHLPQSIRLATEECAGIARGVLNVREDRLMEDLDDFCTRLGTRVLHQDVEVRRVLLCQEPLVGEDDRIHRLVVDKPVGIGNACQHRLIEVAVRGTPKGTKDGQ